MKLFKGILIGAAGTFVGEIGFVIYKDWKRSGLPFPEFIKQYRELNKEWKIEDAKETLRENDLYPEESTTDEILETVKDKVSDTVDKTKEVTKDVVEEVSDTIEEVVEKTEDKKGEK